MGDMTMNTDKETYPLPKWRYSLGYVMETSYHRVFRDDELGVQMKVLTPRKDGAPDGLGELYYYIDGDGREFRTEDDMMQALHHDEMKYHIPF